MQAALTGWRVRGGFPLMGSAGFLKGDAATFLEAVEAGLGEDFGAEVWREGGEEVLGNIGGRSWKSGIGLLGF